MTGLTKNELKYYEYITFVQFNFLFIFSVIPSVSNKNILINILGLHIAQVPLEKM